jgi:RNA polymerase sigma factor (sigma-70 family)
MPGIGWWDCTARDKITARGGDCLHEQSHMAPRPERCGNVARRGGAWRTRRRYRRSLPALQRHLAPLPDEALQPPFSRDEVEDVAHDAYLALCQVEHLQAIKNPRAYLIRTATNLAVDIQRRTSVRQRAQEEMSHTGHLDAPASTPEQIAGDRQNLRILYQCILDLPARCRQVFLLHRYHSWSHQRIADYLGISVHAVEKHVMRALKRCERALENGAAQP